MTLHHFTRMAPVKVIDAEDMGCSIVDLTLLTAKPFSTLSTRALAPDSAPVDDPSSDPAIAECRVGAVIHDFNNSLQAIVSVLNLLQCRVNPGSIKDFDRLMEVALNSTDRAHLQMRKLMSGMKSRVSPTKVTVIDDVVRSLETLLVASVGDAITVDIRLSSGTEEIACDPQEIENILMNLVTNARDAMPDGGALVIETVLLRPQEAGCGNFVGLQVVDTGTGMSPNAIENACQPYFSTKTADKGSGLGLWSVKDFVDRHGGQLLIHSSEQRGTAIQILLPAT